MANEVIIEEYAAFDPSIQCPSSPLTTQIINAGANSAPFNSTTAYIRIRSVGLAFWWKIGGTGNTAAANTAGSTRLPADSFTDHTISKNTGAFLATAT